MNYDLIFIIIIALIVLYHLCSCQKESFEATSVDNEVIKSWGTIAKDLLAGGANVPGNLNVKDTIKASKVQLGDKFLLSGVGDAHGNDGWLRLFDKDGKGYNGGLAAGQLWSQDLYLNNNQFGTMNVTGGDIGADAKGHEFRHNNKTQGIGLGYNTIYATGSNANQDIGLKARGNGKIVGRNKMYVTSDAANDIDADKDGHEFRHSNQTQGIGMGYNTIYATGSNVNQDIGLKARGNGKVRIQNDTVVNGRLTVNRKPLNFSNAEEDWNHTIYNNGFNVDTEGAWDGMKMNTYAGLKVRMGDSNNPKNPAKTVLEATGAGTIIGPDNKQKCNDWILHTPGDDRKNLHVAPKTHNINGTCGDWDWDKQVTIEGSTGDLVVKGNIVFQLPNGQKWIMGPRNNDHFAINKLDDHGFLIRNDGNVWTGKSGTGFNQGGDPAWVQTWQHNSKTRRV